MPARLSQHPEARAAELKDRLLRTLAEMENLRKRTEREIADSRAYAVAALRATCWASPTTCARALDAMSPELRASAESGVKALIEGVELTERELQKALEKNGVSQFTPRGREVRSQCPPGDVRSARPGGAGGQRRRGRAARLHDRRAHAAAGVGRRVEGWPQNRSRRGQAAVNDNAAKAAKDS